MSAIAQNIEQIEKGIRQDTKLIEETIITNPRLSPNNVYKQLTNAAGKTDD